MVAVKTLKENAAEVERNDLHSELQVSHIFCIYNIHMIHIQVDILSVCVRTVHSNNANVHEKPIRTYLYA